MGTLFHWDLYELERENRKLAEFPKFSTLPMSQWPEAYETYFNDHFGFRNTFIHRYRKIMRSAGVSDYRVIYGQDDWLYFNDDMVMQDFIGTREYDEAIRQRQVARLQQRKHWLEKRSIPYLFLIAPNKTTIYPEHLPEDMAPLKANKTNRNYFMERLPDDLTETVTDLTPIIQQAKTGQVVYLRNDTHWNPAGAYHAYTNIVDRIAQRLPDSPPPIPLDQLVQTHQRFIGDLAKMTVSPERYAMDIDLLTCVNKNQWTTNEIAESEFLIPEHMPIDGKPPFVVHNPAGHGTAVIFHDSFTLRLMEYLPHQFKDTFFVWRYSNRTLLPLVVERFHPDMVIEQCVERHLVDQENGALLDDLDMAGDKNGL
ncbi:MAG: hypothetical protein JXR25_06905 [Pontiellaceae bacterium]|nr:hypothetical protein [Pontiellaceae bacterium]